MNQDKGIYLLNDLLLSGMKNNILFIFLFFTLPIYCQVEKVFFELEKTPLKISINPGIYRSRLPGSTTLESGFNQPAFFAQVYFPFKRSLDIPSNFERPNYDSTYYDRLFTASPIAVFHLTEKGGNGIGLGQELSFKVSTKTFIKSQLAILWVESNAQKNDGLKSGLNFHHYWYVSSYISQNVAISIGYNHISNGKILSRQLGSVFDMLTVGACFTFSKRK